MTYMKFTILVHPSLVIITIVYTLFDLCLGVEKKNFKEIMQFHYLSYMTMPLHTTPTPGVMKFTILVNPSGVIITTYLVCLIYAWE